MKKKILLFLTIISLLISSISLQGFSVAQTVPGYVGVSEGDVYEWEVKMQNSTIDKMVDGVEGIKDDIKDQLGPLGDLNLTEFIKQSIDDLLSPILPSNWQSLNLTQLFEDTISTLMTTLNDTLEVNLTNWEAMNLTTFGEEFIESYEVGGYTLYEVIDKVINETETVEFGKVMPLDWEELTLKELIEWEMNNFMDKALANVTGDTFQIPTDWANLNFTSFMSGMIPGLDKNFINFVLYLVNFTTSGGADMFFDWDMGEFLDIAISELNSTNPLPGIDLVVDDMSTILNVTMMMLNSDLGAEVIPEDWETLNMSTLFNDVMLNLNDSIGGGFDLLGMNLSTYIGMMKMGVNQSLYSSEFPFEPSITAGEILNNATCAMILELNQTGGGFLYYNISHTWYELSVNQLLDELWNLAEMQYRMAMNQLDQMTGLLSSGLNIRFSITDVLPEAPIMAGVNATMLNFTFAVDPGLGEYQNVTWDMGPIYIIDPVDLAAAFPEPMEALAIQASTSLLLFLPTTYDRSQITFKTMTMDMPSTMPDITMDMDWDSNGILDYAQMKYGSDTMISIGNVPPSGGGIPGYAPIIIIGLSAVSILGLIYILRKRNVIKYQ